VYLKQGRYARAEAVLREALANYPSALANTFNWAHAQSLLGASLCGQRRHSDAEPLLLSGYENMLRTQAATPAYNRSRVEEAGKWIVALYEGSDNPQRAAEWRRKISESKAAVTVH
jgi:TolA-binding protein